MRILFLDDDPERHRCADVFFVGYEITHVYSASAARIHLDLFGPWDAAYLDHDLRDYGEPDEAGYRVEYTGQDVARHIVAMTPAQRPKRVVIHSWNPDGARLMLDALRDAGVNATLWPFEFPSGWVFEDGARVP